MLSGVSVFAGAEQRVSRLGRTLEDRFRLQHVYITRVDQSEGGMVDRSRKCEARSGLNGTAVIGFR